MAPMGGKTDSSSTQLTQSEVSSTEDKPKLRVPDRDEDDTSHLSDARASRLSPYPEDRRR